MVLAAILLATLWYALRAAARVWAPAAAVVRRLSPRTRQLHRWVLSAPASFCYIAIFTASTVIQDSAPPNLIDRLTTYQSTNLVRLAADPVRVLLASSLWIDEGVGLLGYVLVFGTVVAWAERRYGSPRIILIGYSAHIFGSLTTALIERVAINSHRAPASLAYDSDVGVSYVLVGCCAAAILVLGGRWRIGLGAALLVAAEIPVVTSHTFYDLGHLLAVLYGALTAALLLALAPPRQISDGGAVLAGRERAPSGATPCTTDPAPAPSVDRVSSSTEARPSVPS
jgi:hypothetical protein